MQNTLRFALIIIGAMLIVFGIYLMIDSNASIGDAIIEDKSQIYAMIVFGVLSLISGVAYKRRNR